MFIHVCALYSRGVTRSLKHTAALWRYDPGGAPWTNTSLPISARIDDLMSRLSPLQLIAQLTQNGGDVYAPAVQLPRYIVSQECLAGFDGGSIFIAPPVALTASSAFPQPVNMGSSWDVRRSLSHFNPL